MNARGRQRDWAGLVPELVYTIAREVTDISDFIRFRAVCKKWRSATTIADMSPQFPWLLNETTGPDLHFYSIALKKSFTFHVPKISDDEYVVNPCHGLMLVKSSSSKLSWWLLNPLNNNVVSLPSMREFSWELIGSPGYQSRDYVVVEGCKHLNVVKPGDDKWIKLEKKDSDFYFYFKNLLFIFDVFSWFTKVIDLCTHETVFVVPPPPKKFQFCDFGPTLIESYGEVLLVNYLLGSKKIVIQQLEYGNGQGNPHWVEVTSIGDRMLFINFHKLFGAFSLRASDFCGSNLNGNCIYYITRHKNWRSPNTIEKYCTVEKYDIKTATTEELHVERQNNISWYLPALNHI